MMRRQRWSICLSRVLSRREVSVPGYLVIIIVIEYMILVLRTQSFMQDAQLWVPILIFFAWNKMI